MSRGEVGGANVRAPIQVAIGLEIFRRIPECAVIGRIDTHGADVAPFVGGRLLAAPSKEHAI